MKIAIGSDHGGYKLKEFLKRELSADYDMVDFGTDSPESADYPIHAAQVGKSVSKGECRFGIAICTSGIGVSIAANKVRGVRAALVCDMGRASGARKHNNANVLC
ncbi:MAG TPA: RpiB/LacA/LacB family sugar-phosphate isomerase, partial [candidate division Zixibacteria bacterium]|nr:RpiB/LacA/LacB family sugar-phosphate isomerase [candidate division Zixibacteria bacterium]